uniref:Uncharacterized protein n=1 Tax=Cannabis sativa TaxID=3483 RepID=A0A803RC45_CANSA
MWHLHVETYKIHIFKVLRHVHLDIRITNKDRNMQALVRSWPVREYNPMYRAASKYGCLPKHTCYVLTLVIFP